MSIILVVIPTFVIVLDRITKLWAINYACQAPLSLMGDSLSCIVTYNRGVSWGLLSYESILGFSLVTLFIVGVIGILLFHMFVEYRKQNALFGELLVFGGAVANLYDRLMYGGVVDFILFQYGTWSFPIFNIADIAIVCGVLIMLYDVSLRR